MTRDQKPTPLQRIADNIHALINETTTTEIYRQPRFEPNAGAYPTRPGEEPAGTWTRHKIRHKVTAPSLINQLQGAKRQTEEMRTTNTPESKPAASIATLDAYQLITKGVTHWRQRTMVKQRTTLEDQLSSLIAGATHQDDQSQRDLAHDTHTWLIRALIVTGNQPAYEPQVPCPNLDCERWGTLRIRLDLDNTKQAAICTACGTTWDHTLIPTLGAYIRWASEHLTGPRHWKLNALTHELIECVECLNERQAMGNRKAQRIKQAKETAK